jgi:hypothetical protein
VTSNNEVESWHNVLKIVGFHGFQNQRMDGLLVALFKSLTRVDHQVISRGYSIGRVAPNLGKFRKALQKARECKPIRLSFDRLSSFTFERRADQDGDDEQVGTILYIISIGADGISACKCPQGRQFPQVPCKHILFANFHVDTVLTADNCNWEPFGHMEKMPVVGADAEFLIQSRIHLARRLRRHITADAGGDDAPEELIATVGLPLDDAGELAAFKVEGFDDGDDGGDDHTSFPPPPLPSAPRMLPHQPTAPSTPPPKRRKLNEVPEAGKIALFFERFTEARALLPEDQHAEFDKRRKQHEELLSQLISTLAADTTKIENTVGLPTALIITPRKPNRPTKAETQPTFKSVPKSKGAKRKHKE